MTRRNIHASKRGAAAVEFVLILPILIAMLAGMVDASWYLTHYNKVTRVAQDSVRIAAHTYENPQLHEPGSLALVAAQDYAIRAFNLQQMSCEPSICTVSVSRSGDVIPIVTVEIQYTVEPIMGLLLDTLTVTHRASAAYGYP